MAEIGYCLGFEEPAHFSNFFRKHAGMAPSAVRAV
ncbi:helix-turn-helix domain-containing protein [Hymenobacter polaris]|nr:helix-turn-helix domain-containing protein [Hymenobacter polaris]